MIKFLILVFLILLPSTVLAKSVTPDQINQSVTDRFELDLSKMAAIMDEQKRRKNITETRVAFGGIDTPIKSADYWITFAAEAIAYQKDQKFSSREQLRGSLLILRDKILKAKVEVGKAIE